MRFHTSAAMHWRHSVFCVVTKSRLFCHRRFGRMYRASLQGSRGLRASSWMYWPFNTLPICST